MADHARAQIRAAAVAALRAGTFWKMVHASRVPPAAVRYPLLLVYAESEASEEADVHPAPVLKRTMTLVVQGVVTMNLRDSQVTENELDEMAKHIEQIMSGAGIGRHLVLDATEFEIIHDQDDTPSAGTVRLRYRVDYFTASNSPDVLI